MNEQEARDYVMSLTPYQRAQAQKGWSVIASEIEARAAAKKPRPKNFEVYHEKAVSRLAFLKELSAAGDISSAQDAARRSVKLIEEAA